MKINKHTTDQYGFNYMANSGQEEQDRDSCGVIIAVGLMLLLTIFQYIMLY